MEKTGRLIAIEGIDGVGKSTQAKKLVEVLRGRGIPTEYLREPGGTSLGEKLRGILLETKCVIPIAPGAELLMFAAARAQLVQEVLAPALKEGTWIVLDRFHLSTWVYQGIVGGSPASVILAICNQFSMRPHLQIVLDADPETCLQRAEPGRFEAKGMAYMQSVAKAYRSSADFECRACAVLDVNGLSVEDVSKKIFSCVESHFPEVQGAPTAHASQP